MRLDVMNYLKISTWVGVLILNAPVFAVAELIFEDNFDQQPDWTSAMHSTDRIQRANIPQGWYSIRQDPTWAPSTGHSDRHESIEVLASNPDKARGGVGKSYVSYRDSNDPGQLRWNSESMMVKYFPMGYEEIYVEFYIRFSESWTRAPISGADQPISKLFRISSWNGEPAEYQAFGGGNLGPIFLWDYAVNNYGIRDQLSFRGGPHGDNYTFSNSAIPGLPRTLVGSGDMGLNFTQNLAGMGVNGSNPLIPDRVNGGFIGSNGGASVSHDQVFGPGDSWTKMAFYVKMNSSPGAQDGIMRQWINDVQIVNITTIPWIRSSATEDESAKWNVVSIGGNDFFRSYPNEQRYQEWYAFDDIVIMDSIPAALNTNMSAPLAPDNISVSVN